MEQKRYLDYEGLRYVVEHLRKEINTTENNLRREIDTTEDTLRNEINATEPSTISDFTLFNLFNGINSGLPPVVEDFDFIRHYYGTLSPIELVNVNSKVYKSALYSNALGFSVIGIQGSKFVGETDKYTEFVIDNGIDSSLKGIEPMSNEEYSEYQKTNEDIDIPVSDRWLREGIPEALDFIDMWGQKEVDISSTDYPLIYKLLITEIKGVSSFEFFLYLEPKCEEPQSPGASSRYYNVPIVLVSSDFKNSNSDKKPIINGLPVEEDINEYINRANSVSKETPDKLPACVRFVITDLDPNCSYFIIHGNSFIGPWRHPFPIEPTAEHRLFFYKNSNDMNCSFDPAQSGSSIQAVINIPYATNETE